jgi:hypothetical protein
MAEVPPHHVVRAFPELFSALVDPERRAQRRAHFSGQFVAKPRRPGLGYGSPRLFRIRV